MTDSNSRIVETADAVAGSWVYRHAPVRARPYLKLARMDRPVGTWLLLWPCLWSLALAGMAGHMAGHMVDWPRAAWLAVLFAVGALAMRGAGCTYNDIVDRDLDARVARTRTRPLPAGEVSARGAWAFLAVQCLVGLGVLLQLGPAAIALGLASLLLVAAYPFMKRITYWPQAWLGLTFNWGALMGWTALTGGLGWPAAVLYAACVFWTLGYDTIYAHQDKEDDAMAGIKSTALRLGAHTKKALAVFYSLFFIGLAAAGWLANLPVLHYIGLGFAALHLIWQVRTVRLDDAGHCLAVFRANIRFGWIVLAAIVSGLLPLG